MTTYRLADLLTPEMLASLRARGLLSTDWPLPAPMDSEPLDEIERVIKQRPTGRYARLVGGDPGAS